MSRPSRFARSMGTPEGPAWAAREIAELRQTVARQNQTIQSVTTDRDRLQRQVDDMQRDRRLHRHEAIGRREAAR